MRSIAARRHVPRPREELYAQLADVRGHWKLAGRWVDPVELREDGGVVRVRGPFGLHRTIRTTLTTLRAPECVAGEAAIGATRAEIQWLLEEDGSGTLVTLRADVLRAGPLDRAMLALGGAWWMRTRFAATLERLG
ncbi:MAG: SRPBCC family protein [Solirubrobacteraceae bacterium]